MAAMNRAAMNDDARRPRPVDEVMPHHRHLPGDDLRWVVNMRIMHSAEAAAALRVSTSTLRRWARWGWLRYWADGTGTHPPYLYSSEDVQRLVRLCRGRGRPTARLIRQRLADRP